MRTLRKSSMVLALLLSVPMVYAGIIPSATFIANWNGDTGNNGLDANYSAGSVVVQSVGGTPGPVITTPGMYGSGAVNVNDVYPKTTSSSNPTLAYSAFNVVDPNAGSVMFWYKHNGAMDPTDEMRYFAITFPSDPSVGTSTKYGTISISHNTFNDRLYLTISSSDQVFQYLYIDYLSTVITDESFYHITATWDNATNSVAMYIHDDNGELLTSKTATFSEWSIMSTDSSSLMYVTDNAYHARGANGILDDYVISGAALSSAQINEAIIGEATIPEPATCILLVLGATIGFLRKKKM